MDQSPKSTETATTSTTEYKPYVLDVRLRILIGDLNTFKQLIKEHAAWIEGCHDSEDVVVEYCHVDHYDPNRF
jgi:hypothetical protein